MKGCYYMKDISICGTDCSLCYCFGKMCNGCNVHKGKVFHVSEGKACPIYECCINKKHWNDCGECALVPCDIWRNTRDPKYSDEEFEENIKTRLQTLGKSI